MRTTGQTHRVLGIIVVFLISSIWASDGRADGPVKLKRLGRSGTSFSKPLAQGTDLLALLATQRDDVLTVLAKEGTGWTGRAEDLDAAVAAAAVREITIPKGTAIPWMAMRRIGIPDIARPAEGFTWIGPPLTAYVITFESEGREWTLIAPAPCGNFWVTSTAIQVACVPRTCAEEDVTCGVTSDRCGRTLVCGEPCTVANCIREDRPIQFAPLGSPYGRDGLIMHDNDDFGDTAQREGWYWFGVWLRQNRLNQPWPDTRQLTFDDVLRKLEPNGDGVFVRAPGKDPFGRPHDGHNNHGTTRDQLVPLIAAMGVWGKHDALQRLWDALPEDILGKHDFQGHWRDLTNGVMSFESDPCDQIQNRCGAHPQTDSRDCSRGGVRGTQACPSEERQCQSDCATQNCSDVCVPLLGCSRVCVPGVDLNCQGRKLDCERLKAQEDAACRLAEVVCTSGKAAENVRLATEHGLCVAQRTVDLAACVTKKQTGTLHFTGDPLPPSTYMLFLRAGVVPTSIFPMTLRAVADIPGAEVWLKGTIDHDRDVAAGNRDHVDQDMNNSVMLLMSRINLSTPVSESAIASYKSRAHSFGSYFNAYCREFGPLRLSSVCAPGDTSCCTDKACLDRLLKERITAGIAKGWVPDAPDGGPFGALRWYHRWSTRANPRLSLLYEPIFADLLR